MFKIKAGNIYHDDQKQLVAYDGQISAMHWQIFYTKTMKKIIIELIIDTRQNKVRVTPRSKQCNSFFSKMSGLISISNCYNNLTDDALGLDEQFPVKLFFSKNFNI